MYLLAIESTAGIGGVALIHDGQLLGSIRVAHGHNLSGNLLSATEWLLNRHGLTAESLKAVVVDVGPGAFTGVKMGVVMAKVFAHARGIDLIGVNAFEACASVMPEGVPTLVALPARRDALYLQWISPGILPKALGAPAMVVQHALEDWLRKNAPLESAQNAIGMAQAREWIAPSLPNLHWRILDAPPPEGVAQVGWQRWQANTVSSPLELVPFYLQPPSIHLSRRAQTL